MARTSPALFRVKTLFLFACAVAFVFDAKSVQVHGFLASSSAPSASTRRRGRSAVATAAAAAAAKVTEAEARKGIDKVVAALRKDKSANEELGRLDRVTQVVGYGSPTPGTLNVRFNASFKRGGFGRSSVPMPFGLGQTNQSEGRGTMVGQCKAAVDTSTGKVTSCSVFRDLGYGRSFNLKC